MVKEAKNLRQTRLSWVNHFGGGLWTKSTPFSMLVFKPVLHASRSFFSLSSRSERILLAFSAPEG